ncbi:MAG: EcsC family protein [Leptolyngbyaceae cyanobacterium]
MTDTPPPNRPDSAVDTATRMFYEMGQTLQNWANDAGDAFINLIYPTIEQATQLAGNTVAPIADLPLIKFATGIPGISWLLAALGQVNADKIQREIAELRTQYPLETDEKLVQRVVATTTWRAAQVGLLTNIVPPVAVLLFALDLGAIAALQAEMIYKIAALYGFSAEDTTRRGEVLAIWAVFTGSSGTLKSGLSFLEVLPGAGTVIGVSSDAAIIYSVGFLAQRYYEVKRSRQVMV